MACKNAFFVSATRTIDYAKGERCFISIAIRLYLIARLYLFG